MKWPVFLQNAFGNPAHLNQTNLNGKLRKKLGGPSKNLGGVAHPGPPLESPLAFPFFSRKNGKGGLTSGLA